MKAQTLYNIRALTGIVSGADLHDMFRDLTDNPSPSGYADLDDQAVAVHPIGALLLEQGRRPLSEVAAVILEYVGE